MEDGSAPDDEVLAPNDIDADNIEVESPTDWSQDGWDSVEDEIGDPHDHPCCLIHGVVATCPLAEDWLDEGVVEHHWGDGQDQVESQVQDGGWEIEWVQSESE